MSVSTRLCGNTLMFYTELYNKGFLNGFATGFLGIYKMYGFPKRVKFGLYRTIKDLEGYVSKDVY